MMKNEKTTFATFALSPFFNRKLSKAVVVAVDMEFLFRVMLFKQVFCCLCSF